MGDPSSAVRRNFLSQMSNDASWKEIPSTSLGCILTTVFMGIEELPSNYRAKTMTRGGGPDWNKETDWSPRTGTIANFWTHNILCPEVKGKTEPKHRQGFFSLFFREINLLISYSYKTLPRNTMNSLQGRSEEHTSE